MRKVCYITGTRADFGLMKNVLQGIDHSPELELSIITTGMHLLKEYGETWKEIESSGLPVSDKVAVDLSGGEGAEMAVALGQQIIGFTGALQGIKPDLVLLLGDRGEMLAGAVAALHLNIPVAHIHGGELSGTVDEPVRHAISKLSHFHFTSTAAARDRLIRMGEQEANVFVTGAPGLDEIREAELHNRSDLFSEYGLDPAKVTALVLFHPVVQQAGQSEAQSREVFPAVLQSVEQALIIMPNADAGGAAIRAVIEQLDCAGSHVSVTHLPRSDYLSFLAESAVLVGNSSSGIIEAASLGTRVINIGDRQRCRERNSNVVDVPPEAEKIRSAISKALHDGPYTGSNVYGDGQSSSRIVEYLETISLNPSTLEKVNAY